MSTASSPAIGTARSARGHIAFGSRVRRAAAWLGLAGIFVALSLVVGLIRG